MSEIEEILIVGASTRAAAFSAIRGGFRPRCLDLFADADLADHAPVVRFDPDRDADELERLADSLGCESWMFTGSMEARPDLVERLSRLGRRLGNDHEVLRRVRDPWEVADVLRGEGLPSPALRRDFSEASASGRWLRKSRAKAGGLGVAWAEPGRDAPEDAHDFQEFLEGPTFSGLFIAASGRAHLIGAARQFQGVPGAPFLYRGGIAPWTLSEATDAELGRIGEALAGAFGLVGLFGVDFILNAGRPWVVEVNPRFTASVELFELSSGRALLRNHIRACMKMELVEDLGPSRRGPVVGKRVVYARHPVRFPKVEVPRWSADAPFATPPIADVPREGTRIGPGEPILTVLVTAETPEECLARLDAQERGWLDRLG